MLLNLVHAVRHIRRRPVLTAVGVASLAVGIGCAVACASVVNTVLFRAFPYQDPSSLVFVWEDNSKRGVGLTPTSVLNYRDLKAEATSFEALGAFINEAFTIDGRERSERATGYMTTAGLLDQTGVRPVMGRLFTAAEDRPGGPNVVVLSHGLWQRRFGSDPGIIGRDIRLTGVLYTVIGVMPRGFLLPPIFGVRIVNVDHVVKEADLWVPLRLDGWPQRRDLRAFFIVGRLKAGRSVEQAQAETSAIAARLASEYTVDDHGMDFKVVALEEQVLSNVQTLLLLLLTVGLMVLTIASTNAAHLLLVDSLTMSGETAVRSALGASVWRLACGQGMLGAVWCGLATIGALLVASAIAVPVAAYTKANVPRLSEVGMDASTGAGALLLSLVVAIAITLLPIAYAANTSSVRSATAAPMPSGMSRWRRLFVIVQLATAVVVLSTAALLFRSANRLADVNPGFVARGVSVFELMPPEARYDTPHQRLALRRRLLQEAEAPGRATAIVDYLPFGDDTHVVNFTIENHVPLEVTDRPQAALRGVSTGYFSALSIPTVAGRPWLPSDEDERATTVVVNDAFVRRFVPGETIVGRRIKRGAMNAPTPWMTVVGVVGSVRGAGLTVDPQPEVFVPFTRNASRSTVYLIVKSSAPLPAVAAEIVERIHRVDAELAPANTIEMTELVAGAVGQPFFYARLFGVLGVVALFLSIGGVYSVAALGVAARANEIAIRSCLGAQRGDIVRMILRESGVSVAAALAIGALTAYAVQTRVAAFVYGVATVDWSLIALTGAGLAALALTAVYVAIWRLLELRPIDLLRNQRRAFA